MGFSQQQQTTNIDLAELLTKESVKSSFKGYVKESYQVRPNDTLKVYVRPTGYSAYDYFTGTPWQDLLVFEAPNKRNIDIKNARLV